MSSSPCLCHPEVQLKDLRPLSKYGRVRYLFHDSYKSEDTEADAHLLEAVYCKKNRIEIRGEAAAG